MTRRPAENIHPGEMLADELLARQDEWTISYVAERLDIYTSDLRDLMNGQRDITPELSAALGKLLGTTPLFWMDLQEQWYEWRRVRPGVGRPGRRQEDAR